MKNSIYNVTDYGIETDGRENITRKLSALIEQIEKDGGGTIYFPAGLYTSGSIFLKSNMTLYLESGAVIQGSENPEDYPLIDSSRIPGWNLPSHAGLIAAIEAENIAVQGRGKIDGRGWFWWEKRGDHRPRAIQMIACENILIENITIVNSAMWTVHPVCSSNVTIHGITIKNPYDSPNTDGINPEGCKNVRISDCCIDVGDDCVTLKSGTQDDLYIRQHPCENISITNCTMVHGHGGVVMGSEMSGGVKKVTISNCVFCGTDRGIRIKTRRLRGGTVEDIRVSNIVMENVFSPIVMNCFYNCGTKPEDFDFASSPEKKPVQEDTPFFRNLHFSGIIARNVQACACYIGGLPEMPIDGITIENFSVEMAPDAQPKPLDCTYDDAHAKGKGLLISNAKNLFLRNIRISAPNESALEAENIENLSADGIQVPFVSEKPVFRLKNAIAVYIAAGGLKKTAPVLSEQTDCKDVTIE